MKESQQVIGHDTKSNIFNYKYTYCIDIAPICKHDLIYLDKSTNKKLGGIGPLLICSKVSSQVQLLDPITFITYEFDSNTYWKYNFKAFADQSSFSEYLVINVFNF